MSAKHGLAKHGLAKHGLAERLEAEELMDDPALLPATYSAVIADLSQVNRVTMAYRPTLQFLAKALGNTSHFTLLDVGYGHGDMLRMIAQWAKRNGKTAQLTGIDLNPASEPIATAATAATAASAATAPGTSISFQTGDYQSLPAGQFDVIISSLVAHHMTHSQLLAFLRFMQREAQVGWFVNDLHRHWLSYRAYPLLARLMGWHPIVRQDGQTSIARSFRPADWQDLLREADIPTADIKRHFPFRLCVSTIR